MDQKVTVPGRGLERHLRGGHRVVFRPHQPPLAAGEHPDGQRGASKVAGGGLSGRRNVDTRGYAASFATNASTSTGSPAWPMPAVMSSAGGSTTTTCGPTARWTTYLPWSSPRGRGSVSLGVFLAFRPHGPAIDGDEACARRKNGESASVWASNGERTTGSTVLWSAMRAPGDIVSRGPARGSQRGGVVPPPR